MIPDAVTQIGAGAFHGCTGLKMVDTGDGVDSLQGFSFGYLNENNMLEGIELESIVIGNNVKAIRGGEFLNCKNLKNVVIGNSVEKIEDAFDGNGTDGAFKGCSSLSQVILPESLTYIGNYAFEGCSSLKTIDIPNNVAYVGKNAFADCSSLSNAIVGSRCKLLMRGHFLGALV